MRTSRRPSDRTRSHIARARIGVEHAMSALREAADRHDRALSLFSTWQAIAEGRDLFYGESTGGAFSVGNHVVFAVDHSELTRPLRARLSQVDDLLAKVATPVAPAPEPVESEFVTGLTADRTAYRQVKRADAVAPVRSDPTKPAA